MSDLINNYNKCHEEFVDLLVEYYPLHEKFLDRQSPQRTVDLRKHLKEMRLALKRMEEAAQLRMHERRAEWNLTHRVKKENKNDSNSSTD
jgi:hypothetical protein